MGKPSNGIGGSGLQEPALEKLTCFTVVNNTELPTLAILSQDSQYLVFYLEVPGSRIIKLHENLNFHFKNVMFLALVVLEKSWKTGTLK